jgi:hypothetical protein
MCSSVQPNCRYSAAPYFRFTQAIESHGVPLSFLVDRSPDLFPLNSVAANVQGAAMGWKEIRETQVIAEAEHDAAVSLYSH